MEEFVVYIMYSEAHDIYYKGITSDLIQRFRSHDRLATKGYTIKYRPWKVVHVEFFRTKEQALTRERFLKSGKGRQWIRQQNWH
ncbi:MAG: GIY-YIG nuclease family protein [Sediminicola sp.]